MRIGLPTIIGIGESLTPFPTVPMEFTQSVITVDRDSYDDLGGNLQRPAILGKRDKFSFTFPPMYSSQINAILPLLNGDRIKLKYRDYFDENIIHEGYFYHGDMEKSPMIIKTSSNTLWNGLTFNLISYNIRK